ncbi:hypothetical protein BFJ70_g3529 [Fusarium oxysporum]|uniref:F-box domain-containing protein n=1 Tax=Fusarium oxysporum Fo47 TaxID=660027 RepID=W9L162_FUSOX|nr:uncharacterized protein FOBCDRAFT_284011 [Fusarium oxysporum Fo47]EWZ92045.1 hypothetical protein FOWG_07343 [Fusarium oxysporum f. sp. lycopersici MN25]KAJ4159030.1 hypothetical protein NW765_012674 [Fusarium oxysporum]EWZ50492.1 hypothetical protein FOZG_00987 [Fusarium oxysporum Fo47]KAJ4278519.1 hypothetical protein NW764_007315 [Fusarium oxysporum]RKL45520.1 hypothetical protein BFJ70_g3529 [Fusarium oxysporum]
MSGIPRAYNSFRYDDNINTSREGIRLASVVIDRPEPENGPSDMLPGRLAAALYKMTGLHSLSLDLEHFNDGQDEDSQKQMAFGQLVWPKLHSLRFHGSSGTGRTILRHCDPNVLHTLHLHTWTDSEIVEKARGIVNLRRLHLYYDRADLTEPATLACVSEKTWDEVRAILWVRIHNSVFMDYLILREANVDIQGHLDDDQDMVRLIEALRNMQTVVKYIRHLAFSLDHRRFSPRLIRFHLNGNQVHHELTRREVDLWYKKIIVDLMDVKRLVEVWVFAYDSLAFHGTRNSDKTVSVRRITLKQDPQKNSFPWGVLDD